MNATAEVETTVQEEAPTRPRYTPPEVYAGDEVVYLRDGVRRHDAPVGKVLSVCGNALTLALYDRHNPDGSYHEDVLHIDNPVLADNPDRRMNGAWEFSKKELAFKAMQARQERYGDRQVESEAIIHELRGEVARCHKRISDLEALMTAPESKPAKK